MPRNEASCISQILVVADVFRTGTKPIGNFSHVLRTSMKPIRNFSYAFRTGTKPIGNFCYAICKVTKGIVNIPICQKIGVETVVKGSGG